MTKQEFMACSLPHGLKLISQNGVIDYHYQYFICIDDSVLIGFRENTLDIKDVRPILHPLSDFTKEIEHKGEKFVPIEWLIKDGYYIGEDWIAENFKDVENSSFGFIQKLIEWHFDISDLIEKGEAIDVNTLSENPYK